VVLLDNTAMLRVLQCYGWVLAAPTEDFSVAFLEIPAIGGMPGWWAVSAGRRVLVERRGWSDDGQVAALRSASKEVRQCSGPLRKAGSACSLVASGRCRLAEEAEVIVSLLPAGDPDCAAVLGRPPAALAAPAHPAVGRPPRWRPPAYGHAATCGRSEGT